MGGISGYHTKAGRGAGLRFENCLRREEVIVFVASVLDW